MAAPQPAMTMPAAAASAVYPMIAGPMSTGVVLGSFSQAVIIGLDTAHGPWAVSLLGPLAARVPNGVRFGAAKPDFGAYHPGDLVTMGGGVIGIDAHTIAVARRWSSRVFGVVPDVSGVRVIETAAAGAKRGVPPAAVANLERSLAAGNPAPAVHALVGLGEGLTPGGDDVLAGLLTGLHASGQRQLAGHVAEHVLDGVLDRTTVLSADLLRLAAAGHACVEALDVLRAVHTGHQVPAAVHRLLSIGHTSGADLATGLAMGLRMGLRCGRNMSRYGAAPTTIR